MSVEPLARPQPVDSDQHLSLWNDTDRAYPADSRIFDLFAEQVASRPDAAALIGGEESLTYAELALRAEEAARALRARGVGRDRVVGVRMHRSVDMVCAMLAVLRAGGAYLPLDPDAPDERNARLVRQAGADLVIDDRPGEASVSTFTFAQLREEGRVMPPLVAEPGSALDLAYVIFTSGSTGSPKGVAVPHRAVARLVKATNYAVLDGNEVLLHAAPPTFDASIFEIWGALLNGAALVIHPAARPDVHALRTLIQAHGVTTVWMTSGLLEVLVDQDIATFALVRRVLTGGDIISPRHIARLLDEMGCEVVCCYGPTECTTFATSYALDPASPLPPGPLPIGAPISNTRAYVLDEDLNPSPPGVVGDLYIAGPGVARGYINAPALTAERYLPDPYGPAGARMYQTGDRASWRDDGLLDFHGREDDQVKVRGYRIEPAEVQAALLADPAIRHVAVVVRAETGGRKRLVAYVTASGPDPFDEEAVRENLASRLPDYMMPSAFVCLERLPVTTNGKIDKAQLPAPRWPAPGDGEPLRTPTERLIGALWRELLGVAEVDRDSDFFVLGADSLVAMRLASRLRQITRTEVVVGDVFNHPRLSDLADTLDARAAKPTSGPSLSARPRAAPPPLSFAQERLWFLQQLGLTGAAYNVPLAFELDGNMDDAALLAALAELVQRHESLRTRFDLVSGEPRQIIVPASAYSPRIRDLGESADAEAVAAEITAEESGRAFDLAHDLPIQVTLLRIGPWRRRLLITLHHIVTDEWSNSILLRELAALYRAATRGVPAGLAPPAVQYADYAEWQREKMSGARLAGQIAFWRSQLEGAPERLTLPTDKPRPSVPSYAGAYAPLAWSRELTEALNGFARSQGASLFMVMLAAFTAVLSRLSGQNDIVIGAPIAGRTEPETEGLVGFLVNTLALRTRLRPGLSFRELVSEVKQTALSAYAHQDAPFERVVADLRPGRDLSHQPIFQANLAMQNVPYSGLQFDGVTVRGCGAEHRTALFDLSLFVYETADGLRGGLEYATDLFEAQTAERVLESLHGLLAAALADPARPLEALGRAPSAAVRVCAPAPEAGSLESALKPNVLEGFSRTSLHRRAALACVAPDGRLTFAELDARSNQVARLLREHGVGPDVTVAIAMDPGVNVAVALLAILKAGGAFVPLDPRQPSLRLSAMLQLASVRLVLCDAGARQAHAADPSDWLVIDDTTAANADAAPVECPAHRGDLAYVIFTSGSTGAPKGVMVHHAAALNYLDWARAHYGMRDLDGAVVSTSLAFDATLTSLLAPLLSGVCVRFLPHAPGVEALTEALETRHGRQLFKLTPSHLELLRIASVAIDPQLAGVLVVGGEALSATHLSPWRAAPGMRIFNEYGPTETVVGCSVYQVAASAAEGAVPIGRAIDNTQLFVLDERLEPVAPGAAGELYIAGESLALGYIRQPGLTAERFIPCPFGPSGHRMYKTGDFVRLRPDGELEYLGRADDQIKVRGFRVEPGEIEAVMANCRGVASAVVTAREDSTGEKQLVGYVVVEVDAESTPKIAARTVGEWVDVFDRSYQTATSESGPTFAGWTSSYTGELIAEPEMAAWLTATVDRIAALSPERVLEIGCGVGLIAERVAPHCAVYVGLDFSREALREAAGWMRKRPEMAHVRLLEGDALALDAVRDERFDTIIINSVAQYFPDRTYLLEVLRRAARLLTADGRVFLGDLRNLHLLADFHGSVQAGKVGAAVSSSQLQARIHGAASREKELLVSPSFVRHIGAYLPEFAAGEVLLKAGAAPNELTRYRFDAVLRRRPAPSGVPPVRLSWRNESTFCHHLVETLAWQGEPAIHLTGVPNGWRKPDVALQSWLKEGGRRPLSLASGDDATLPDHFYRLGVSHGYEVSVSSRDDDFASFDVLFTRIGSQGPGSPAPEGAAPALAQLFNRPESARRRETIEADLRSHLKASLPDYMRPGPVIFIDALPLTPNGKIDKTALPPPEDRSEAVAYAAPTTPLEVAMVDVWRELLHLERVGLDDNFFELGGHSLLATRMIVRIGEVFGIDLRLRLVFEHPTARQLLEVLLAEAAAQVDA